MVPNEGTRLKILAAALDEFSAKGFAGVRVDQIAQAAGVNKAMIYYYFSSKEDLFNAIFQSELEGLKRELALILPGSEAGPPQDQVSAAEAILAYAGQREKFLAILVSAAVLQPEVQPHLFQLLDISAAAGLAAAGASDSDAQQPNQDALLHELFTGLLPLASFILLRDGLMDYYGWDEASLNRVFIQDWLRQHLG